MKEVKDKQVKEKHVWNVVNSIIKNPSTKIEFDRESSEIRYVISLFKNNSNESEGFSLKQLYETVSKTVSSK
ncbi:MULTISPECIES: hypothetical protein [unclassified Clostridium]|uniref:hypothetical protein n=1 Tax=unclassified Clostridium TaxID=2614128 RepID=UPI00029857CC|nr:MULTISPECIES: hypothetical protein [unclassified Clostridium]EKQ57937.1 MAG: hypothetical protein A370_00365 [Clostridium sp. Maddingley MBC34-26]